jgi:hypothetical protein
MRLGAKMPMNGENLRLNKEYFDHALLLAGLLPVAKSDKAELACQQTQTGCGQKPSTSPLLGITGQLGLWNRKDT